MSNVTSIIKYGLILFLECPGPSFRPSELLASRLTLTLFSSNSECKQTNTLHIETKIEERERIDEREEKSEKEKGSGRHVSPLPNTSNFYQ